MIRSNIEKYLKFAGITQRELAERVGTTEVSISRYVNGERIPKATTCIQIAKVLNCEAEDLYSEIEDEQGCSMNENEAKEVFKELLDVPCEMLVKYNSVTTEEQKKALVKIRCAEDMAIQALEEIQQYRAIGTIEEFKALKEKSVAKKGIPYTSSNNHKFVECPSCHKDMDLYYDFCQYCGQAVDWGKSKT